VGWPVRLPQSRRRRSRPEADHVAHAGRLDLGHDRQPTPRGGPSEHV